MHVRVYNNRREGYRGICVIVKALLWTHHFHHYPDDLVFSFCTYKHERAPQLWLTTDSKVDGAVPNSGGSLSSTSCTAIVLSMEKWCIACKEQNHSCGSQRRTLMPTALGPLTSLPTLLLISCRVGVTATKCTLRPNSPARPCVPASPATPSPSSAVG